MLRRFRYLIITALFCLPPLGVLVFTNPAASEYHVHSDTGAYTEVTPTGTPTQTPAPPTATLTSTATPTASHTPTEIPTLTVTPTIVFTATLTHTPTMASTAVSTFYQVGNTDGDGLYLRESAGGDEKVKAWPDKTLMMVVGPDESIDGRRWRHVQDPDGNRGYVPVEYLVTFVRPTFTPTEVTTPTPTATRRPSRPTISNAKAQDLAIQSIKQEVLVLDAAIGQEGNRFSLALVVNQATNQFGARQLGERFVRMFKTFSDDTNPGTQIGTGKYDYIITVVYPDQSRIAVGAKASSSTGIRW